jgi:hypothetical protein
MPRAGEFPVPIAASRESHSLPRAGFPVPYSIIGSACEEGIGRVRACQARMESAAMPHVISGPGREYAEAETPPALCKCKAPGGGQWWRPSDHESTYVARVRRALLRVHGVGMRRHYCHVTEVDELAATASLRRPLLRTTIPIRRGARARYCLN